MFFYYVSITAISDSFMMTIMCSVKCERSRLFVISMASLYQHLAGLCYEQVNNYKLVLLHSINVHCQKTEI